MSNFKNDLVNILEMLRNIEIDLNLVGYSETEKKVYYTIAVRLSKVGTCNITDVIETSGYSRSTVYKTIKKFESDDLIKLKQSHVDKREFNLSLSVN